MTRRPVSSSSARCCRVSGRLRAGARNPRAGQRHRSAGAHLGRRRRRRPRTRRTDRHRTARPCRCSPAIACARRRGRVEILFADGSALHLDDQTTVDFQSDEVVRLLDGRVRLSDRRAGARRRRIASTRRRPGCRSTTRASIACRVLRGRRGRARGPARRRGARQRTGTQLRVGRRAHLRRAQAAPSPAYVFNSAAWDAFDRWSESRRDQRLGVSAQYLPDDVRPYAPAFDTYGSGATSRPTATCGTRASQVGWRPYHRGRWASLRPYGWTWIANDPWGWPTHHYGRWGISAGSWFWIPGRTWAPAWVSWGYAPGYVSWCPLGWNNRPVLGFSANVYGGRRYDPWHAWSVLPRRHFGAPLRARVALSGGARRSAAARLLRRQPPRSRRALCRQSFGESRSGPPAARRPGGATRYRRYRRRHGGARVSAAAGGRDRRAALPLPRRAPGSADQQRARPTAPRFAAATTVAARRAGGPARPAMPRRRRRDDRLRHAPGCARTWRRRWRSDGSARGCPPRRRQRTAGRHRGASRCRPRGAARARRRRRIERRSNPSSCAPYATAPRDGTGSVSAAGSSSRDTAAPEAGVPLAAESRHRARER